ncbi:MAG: rod shape-determining protein RodA [Chloroflexi bacterium]|nr:MAG: rod shape-determining protein RodA [Chloroflexota bacterium]
MRVMRAEPSRFADVATRSDGAVWRAYDIQLTTYAALLAALGLAMAYTNSIESGSSVLGNGTTFSRGLMWAGIAVVVFTIATLFDYRWLKTFAWPLYFANLGLLGVTLAIGDGVGGSARWVSVGPLQFQFSELAKILMIAVLAAYLGNREGRMGSLWSILGACVLMGPAWVLVMMQPDLGTSLAFAAILAGMLFLSGASLTWLLVLGASVVAALPFVWAYVLRDYQKDRILSFLDPAADAQGSGWQVIQSQIAVGSGGLFGTGLTNGTQNRGEFLPVQETDFVFAILAEELGFIGSLVVFVLFCALLWRILTTAWRSKDPFGALFGAGVASMLLFQVFVNIGMVIGIVPITGIPLPFITHGGASLISISLGLGVLQSINIRQHRAEW